MVDCLRVQALTRKQLREQAELQNVEKELGPPAFGNNTCQKGMPMVAGGGSGDRH